MPYSNYTIGLVGFQEVIENFLKIIAGTLNYTLQRLVCQARYYGRTAYLRLAARQHNQNYTALAFLKATPHKDHLLDFARVLLASFPSDCTIRPSKAAALRCPHCTN